MKPIQCHDPMIQKHILWSSNPYEPNDYYADKVVLLEHEENGELAIQLEVNGECIRRPLTVKMERI